MINFNKSVNIFSFYSSSDEALYIGLKKFLGLSKKRGLLNEIWDNHETIVTQQATDMEEHVNQAHIILFLLSVDFLLSDYAGRAEVKRALERHKAGEARVIPILLRPVYFEDSPFGTFQVLPAMGRPVTSWPNQDAAFLDVSNNLCKIIEAIRASM